MRRAGFLSVAGAGCAGRVGLAGFAGLGGVRRALGALSLTLSAAALLGAASLPAHAEVAAADPIDTSMRTCLARSDMSSTMGQVQCMDTARIGWNTALNNAWQQLQQKLPPAQRKQWEKSQTSWQASREAEKELFAAVFATTHGTIYQITAADMQLQPVRDRALTLRSEVAKASAGGGDPPRKVRACRADAQCEHAMFDLNRYQKRLQSKMPARTRVTLTRAQKAWTAYLNATTPVVDERSRVDIIGARVATLKRLSETVGNS